MNKYRLICPDCGASIVVKYPEALVWELCPACLKHVWDSYDALMAEVCDHQEQNHRNTQRWTGPLN